MDVDAAPSGFSFRNIYMVYPIKCSIFIYNVLTEKVMSMFLLEKLIGNKGL